MVGERGKSNWESRVCNQSGKKEQTCLFTFSPLLPSVLVEPVKVMIIVIGAGKVTCEQINQKHLFGCGRLMFLGVTQKLSNFLCLC